MNGVGSDLLQGKQHKIPEGETRMGNDEVPSQEDGFTREENIDIDTPGAVAKVRPALHEALDVLDCIQQVEGRKRSVHFQDLIIKPTLVGIADGLGAVQRRCAPNPETEFFEQGPRPPEIVTPVSLIAPEG
jgi:hypothetical protein